MNRNVLYLIRGLPGSGKSTLAKKLVPFAFTEFSSAFEADDYFLDENMNYCFDSSKLKEAHQYCLDKVKDAMSRANPDDPDYVFNIAVANTFSQQWEVDPYLKLAEDYDYSVFIIECQSNFGSVHDVSTGKIDAMKARWEKIKCPEHHFYEL